jgi:hypothetical protein
MSPIVAFGVLLALEAGVIYVVADDVLGLGVTGTQAAWLALAVAVAPAVVFFAIG